MGVCTGKLSGAVRWVGREKWGTNTDFDNIGLSGEAVIVIAINQRVFAVFTLDALKSIGKS